jgi:hypothetical protein
LLPVACGNEQVPREVSVLGFGQSEAANIVVDELVAHEFTDFTVFRAEVRVAEGHVVDLVALEVEFLGVLGDAVGVLRRRMRSAIRVPSATGSAQAALGEAQTTTGGVEEFELRGARVRVGIDTSVHELAEAAAVDAGFLGANGGDLVVAFADVLLMGFCAD